MHPEVESQSPSHWITREFISSDVSLVPQEIKDTRNKDKRNKIYIGDNDVRLA